MACPFGFAVCFFSFSPGASWLCSSNRGARVVQSGRFWVTVPVEEIMVVQSGLVRSEGRSLRRRGYPEIGIGSSLFLIGARRSSFVPEDSHNTIQ